MKVILSFHFEWTAPQMGTGPKIEPTMIPSLGFAPGNAHIESLTEQVHYSNFVSPDSIVDQETVRSLAYQSSPNVHT